MIPVVNVTKPFSSVTNAACVFVPANLSNLVYDMKAKPEAILTSKVQGKDRPWPFSEILDLAEKA
jgi:hypothetical protein